MTAQTRHRALKASRQEIAARPLPRASHPAVQQTHARHPYRFLRTGLAELAAPPVPVTGSRSLAAASRAYTSAIDDLARHASLAA